MKSNKLYTSLFEIAKTNLDNAEFILKYSDKQGYEYDEEFIASCFEFLRMNIHKVIWYDAELGEYDD